MKTGIFLLCLCASLSFPSHGQSSESEPSKIAIGLKAGANLYDTYQSGRKYFVSQPNAGFHAGVYGDYSFNFLNKNLTARVEALFSTRGLYLSEHSNFERIDYVRECSYVDFPVSVNHKLWRDLRVHIGVVPSLFIEEYRSITVDGEKLNVDEGDQFRSYERWQLGALAGASYTFELMGQQIEAGARYSMGLTRTTELIRDVRASRDPRYMMLQAYIAYKAFKF